MVDLRRSSTASPGQSPFPVTSRRKKIDRRHSANMLTSLESAMEQQQSEVHDTSVVIPTTSLDGSSARPVLSSALSVRLLPLLKKRKSGPSTYFTPPGMTAKASMATISNKNETENALVDGKKYDEMMDRFQIRRRSATESLVSLSGSNSTVKSMKVQPIDRTEELAQLRHSQYRRTGTLQKSSQGSSAAQSPREEILSQHERNSDRSDDKEIPIVAKSPVHSERFSLGRFLRRAKRKLQRNLWLMLTSLVAPISPYSVTARVRSLIVLIPCVAYAVSFPLELAFFPDSIAWFQRLNVCVEMVLLADFFLMFNTAFVDKRGFLVNSRSEICFQYLKSWFLPDLLSSVPAHTIKLLLDGYFTTLAPVHVLGDIVFRTNRTLHLVFVFRLVWFGYVGRSGRSIWTWFLYSRYSHLIRITWIIVLVLLLAHYMACFWKMLEVSPKPMTDGVLDDYAANFYDALQLLQAQGVATQTVQQNLFASFAVLAGSIVLAIVFGHVAMLVSNFNANTTNYQRKMESVFAVMTKMQLPIPLRERIHQYYEHLWREYDSLDGEIVKFSKDLTHNLALEVVLFKYMMLVMHVPYWRDCSADFQKQIVLHLQVRVYLPDDFIIRRGEVGDEFYMINRGVCELARNPESFEHGTAPLHQTGNSDGVVEDSLYSTARYNGSTRFTQQEETNQSDRNRFEPDQGGPDPDFCSRRHSSKNLTQLNRGQAFGEIALLMNYERMANVRAVSYVEMCVLTRSDFQEVLRRYPNDRRHVIMQILTTFMDQNESHRGFCPLKDMVRSVMYDGDIEAPLSTMHAALLVAEVMDPKLEDETVKFGIDPKLAQQLSALKNQNPTHTTETDPALSPALDARLRQIEETQNETLRVVQDVLRTVEELKRGQLTPTIHDSAIQSEPQPSSSMGGILIESIHSPSPPVTGIRIDEPRTIQQLRHAFVPTRSASSPNIHDLGVHTQVASAPADQSGDKRDLPDVGKRVTKFTSAANPLLLSRAKRSSTTRSISTGIAPTVVKRKDKHQIVERRKSVNKNAHSELPTWKPFFERLVMFTSTAESPVQSPTQYADQLFNPRTPPKQSGRNTLTQSG